MMDLPASRRTGVDSLSHRGSALGWGRLIGRAVRNQVGVALFAVALLVTPTAALAIAPSEMLTDPTLEARARAIASELRCLVCQNQSIDDSDAALAKDLRQIVRDKLKEGASDAEVRAYVVARYGDFVLLRPPLKIETLALWGAPLIALLGGAYAIYAAFRRGRRKAEAVFPLTEAERAQLAAITASPAEGGGEARD
jgi:cytochrome c-type biogenesis protein CcmH